MGACLLELRVRKATCVCLYQTPGVLRNPRNFAVTEINKICEGIPGPRNLTRVFFYPLIFFYLFTEFLVNTAFYKLNSGINWMPD